MKKVDINDLYFGVKIPKMSFNSLSERNALGEYNLFDFSKVKWSVAKYATMTKTERESLLSDPLHFCFGDTCGRCEFEFIICPWPFGESDTIEKVGQKVDVFTYYVKPNANYLMYLVNSVSKKSARKYLQDERRRLRDR